MATLSKTVQQFPFSFHYHPSPIVYKKTPTITSTTATKTQHPFLALLIYQLDKQKRSIFCFAFLNSITMAKRGHQQTIEGNGQKENKTMQEYSHNSCGSR